MKMIAVRNRSFVNPTWGIKVDDYQDSWFKVSFQQNRYWVIEDCVDRYGVSRDRTDVAQTAQRMVNADMTLAQVLATLRGVQEAQDEMYAAEAAAERETEMAVERFYENRMTDEDKAREDWEYANLS